MLLLGIDVGTTGVKTVLVSEKGELRAESTHAYPLFSPKPNWFEQNPDDWWNAAVHSIKQACTAAQIRSGDIAGVGLSGQYHGLVLLDKHHTVLRPCILWNDGRTASQAEYITEKVGKERLLRIAATSGAPYFSACKLQWVRDNEPGIFERVYKLMLPKDYIRFKLTGEIATDVTDASGTLFLDIRNRCWSSEIPTLLDIDSSILPGLLESSQESGRICKKAALQTGLNAGTPVSGGAGDQAAAAVGIGIVEEGAASYSIGTSGVIYAATDGLKIDTEGRANTFCHAVEGKWCLLACINAAAGSYQWFLDKLADREKDTAKSQKKDLHGILEETAASVPLGSEKLLFLPYLSGERHPHTDMNARGVFFGLHTGHGRAHMLRSILEGVAYSFRDCLEVIKEHDIMIREIRATGGGARSSLWMEIQVNVSGRPIVMMDQGAGGGAAFGAAILGGVCTGLFPTVSDACAELVKKGRTLIPDKNKSERYNSYYELFRTLYPALKKSYRWLTEI
jgi:xylulokinase